MSSTRAVHHRSLSPVDGHSPHFLAALQIVAHVMDPLRKALVHFFFTTKQLPTLDKLEWKTLKALGKILKELITLDTETSQPEDTGGSGSDSDDDEPSAPPIDPLEFYMVFEPCLQHLKKTCQPKTATEALQILLDTILACAKTLPLTSHLWVTMLDAAGLGLMVKAAIVGKCPLIEDHQILQRTQRETILEWCPLVLPKSDSLEQALANHCGRQPYVYDFDTKPFQFQVRIPLLSPEQAKDMDTSEWTVTKTMLFSTLTSYLFLGIDRLNKETGVMDESEVQIPKLLDLTKLCEKTLKGSKEYELVGGMLHDEGDFVAILKNPTVQDPEDDEAWFLMESEEVIPMTEADALDFLKGEEEGSPCGTMAIYRRKDDHAELTKLLSDIVIAQVSGSLDTNSDFYYEEEVIED
eukprot:Nitzschia sp. Nitz4//scaffold241_size29735//24921//26150//NITZ4_008031-RA/size29735-processed-gene-0.10-mRNA-1//-1//CDS//3329543790//986//frame0